ncbi:MAG TPA: putative sugar O-methyltransferase, partial [Methylocystis sp.]
LAQYLGLARAECAEQNFVGETLVVATRALAAEIETALGFAIAPPSVFDGLYGLTVGDRVLDGRDIQALYAALRVIEASGLSAPRICEIGGGFGKVARYALLRGARHYTIVDLPTVSAMQYFFLSRALPETRIAFRDPADAAGESGVDLVFAPLVDASAKIAADIVINCDSFPEMGDKVCRGYFEKIGRWAPLLVSINQEANRKVGDSGERQSVVGDLLPDYGFTRRYRFRSWIRRGYVEELWSAPAASDSRNNNPSP